MEMATYRAAIYSYKGSETVLTGPEHAHLSDEELIEEAVREAYRADIVGEYPRVPETILRERIYIGDWTE